MKHFAKILFFYNLIIITLFITSCVKAKNISTNIINSPNYELSSTSSNGENSNLKKAPLGTWWWNKDLDIDEYLSFAVENNINEIYFCDYTLGENTINLLNKANNYNIKIYLLAGEKEWLNDRTDLDNIIDNYIRFQNTNEYKLSGIHLDIEPHQFNDFNENRTEYLYKLINIIKTNKELYNNINFDYDIPFWLDDDINYNSINKPAYNHIIDYADRTFIMSYRDTATAMYETSLDEINYAKNNNKILFLSAETYSEEGDIVSYYEEGKKYMDEELAKLRNIIPNDFGIAIHNIKTYKELKD